MKALTFSRFGGAEVLDYIEVPRPSLKDLEVLVEVKAIGLNFADIYRRKGNYHLLGNPPFIAGYEGAGVVLDTNGSSALRPGDRVAFADVPFANAEFVAAPAAHLIPLPADVSFEVAASLLLQGMTAQYLATDSHATKSGEIALIHAAAGGVGQLLTQISRLLGATVIGLTSSPAKQVVSSAAGASAVFLYSESWQNQVREFTGGNGVDVVYDSVGSTLTDSIKVTKECGQIVFYGMAGGNPAPVDPRVLMDGSKTLTGGDLWSYLTSAEKRISRANQLFEWVRQGQLRLEAPTTFQLAEGRQAHEYLESRQSTGKILLLP